MTRTRTALILKIVALILIVVALILMVTPASAATPRPTTGESPAHVAQVEPGKLLLTLIIVQPGTVESNATDSTPTTETPTTETPTTELTPECPGHYSTPGPHPCPQANRTGIDNAHSDPTPATPSPQPEPRRGNDS